MQKACTSIVFTTGNIAGSNTIGLLNGHSDKSRNFNYFSMLLFVQRNRSVPWYHSLVALHTVVKHHVPGYDARAGFWIPNFQNWHPNDVWNLWKTGQHSSLHKMWTFMPSGQASMESSYKLICQSMTQARDRESQIRTIETQSDIWNLWTTGKWSCRHEMWTFTFECQTPMESSSKHVNTANKS
jgi:hypothetical protein